MITLHVASQTIFESGHHQRDTYKLRENSEKKKKKKKIVFKESIEQKEEEHQKVTEGITLSECSGDLQSLAFLATFCAFENLLYKTQGQKFVSGDRRQYKHIYISYTENYCCTL